MNCQYLDHGKKTKTFLCNLYLFSLLTNFNVNVQRNKINVLKKIFTLKREGTEDN